MQQPSEFLALLEAERHDLSYRYGGKSHQPQVITFVKPDKERERKMYNAGRAAAGATDRVALAAQKWLQKELAKRGNK